MKKNVYICITESLCYTPETNTTLWINYTSIWKKITKYMWLAILYVRVSQEIFNMLLLFKYSKKYKWYMETLLWKIRLIFVWIKPLKLNPGSLLGGLSLPKVKTNRKVWGSVKLCYL